MATEISPGIYNVDYYSSSQVCVYIGDIFVDEITSITYGVQQNKRPIYGYANQFFSDVAQGQVLVQGQFTINFKEAGYLWLILDHVKQQSGQPTVLNPFNNSQEVRRLNVERIIDGDTNAIDRNDRLSTIASYAALTGFPGGGRLPGAKNLGLAEGLFEQFEDAIWGPLGARIPSELDRRADDASLNGFDIFIAFGDFAGNNRNNHTIQKISNVHILGTTKQIMVDGMGIQEQYSFFARNQV